MHRVIEYACISRKGKARTCNQDAVLAAGSVGYGELQHRHGAAAARAAAVFGVFD